MRINTATIMAGVLAIFACQAATADEFSIGNEKRPISAGIGILYKDKPYRNYDSDDKSNLVPIILYEGSHFFVRGSNLGFKLFHNKDIELSVIGEYLADGYESSDSDYLTGMSDRDPSFGLGGQLIWNPDKLGVKMTAVSDVSGNSNGQQMRGEVFYKYRTGDWMLRPSVGAVLQTDDYNDYYYGVRNREAIPAIGRYAYSADYDINYRLAAVAVYQQKTSPWMFIGGLRYEIYGDEIYDSPIVESGTELSALLGFAYTFR